MAAALGERLPLEVTNTAEALEQGKSRGKEQVAPVVPTNGAWVGYVTLRHPLWLRLSHVLVATTRIADSRRG